MNKNTCTINPGSSLIQVLSQIQNAQLNGSTPLTVNLTRASFRLTRDFFYVLKERYHKDDLVLVIKNESDVQMARSIGLQAELAGTLAEFDKKYEKNILAHNMSMLEYFIYEVKRGFSYVGFLVFEKLFKKEKIYHIRKSSPNMFLIVTGLIISITLLLFIFHFAVSKTFVYISPQLSNKPISANIVYAYTDSGASLLQGRNTIKMKNMEVPVETTMQFTLDTVDPNSTTNASGKATIYNELDAEQTLKPMTRFVSEDGSVFRVKSWVTVPGAHTENGITEIGTAEVILVADPNDEGGKTIGNRGNIMAGAYLSIPGLKFNRDKVYAKATENFIGGSDPRIHMVTEAEVNKFKDILHEQLGRIARTTLESKLTENKQKYNEDFSLLMGESVTFSGETIEITSGQKYGDAANDITMKGTVIIHALVYDRQATIAYLTDVFHEGLLHGTDKELAIYPETLRLANVVSRAEDNSRIKCTMEMDASITYDFENATNDLTRHMKVLIAGLSREEAKSRLINDGHVKDVTIEFSPFWIRNVSSNIDNIDFIIQR